MAKATLTMIDGTTETREYPILTREAKRAAAIDLDMDAKVFTYAFSITNPVETLEWGHTAAQ